MTPVPEFPEGLELPLPPAESPSGSPAPESDSERMVSVARRLMERGVSGSQVRRLLHSYELDRIERQLAWIDARRAKRKSSLLIAAIDQDYEEPHGLKVLRELEPVGPDDE